MRYRRSLIDAAEYSIPNGDEFIGLSHLEHGDDFQRDAVVPWPVAPRPFFEEAFGSWLGRVASRYDISVGMLWERSIPSEMPRLGNAGWLIFPPVPDYTLERFARLARLGNNRLEAIQTPIDWTTDRQCVPYCFKCLVLNDADVAAPRWKREWLDPTADRCRVHHTFLETVPASIFRKAGNLADARRAIGRHRNPYKRHDPTRIR
ncbi:TniQ family protein [Caballeronia novacaledonica]|uniref:TniQ family protein n=1 Tax=Caballeronia novacaledonica TaxID=1544861 RepID=UPI001EE37C61|nr:TniQ family protein [Caballeronia novacaledonica]GJH12731.1 TniQ family protein [Caballeronia novacaledonica]